MKCTCIGAGAPCKSCGCINNPEGVGHRANGDVCSNSVVVGTHRCHMHGGSSPTALLKAQQSMALLRMPAIEALHEGLETLRTILEQFNGNTCGACGYPKGDVDEMHAVIKAAGTIIRQAQVVLDRTDIGPKATLEVKQSDGDMDLKSLTDDERSRMIALYSEFKTLKEEIQTRVNQRVM